MDAEVTLGRHSEDGGALAEGTSAEGMLMCGRSIQRVGDREVEVGSGQKGHYEIGARR